MISEEAKKIFLKYFFKSFKNYNWKIEDWVVLDDHYHLMAEAPQDAETISQVINNLHRFASGALNKFLNKRYNGDLECTDCVSAELRKVNRKKKSTQSINSKKKFHNYWDTCITYERSYFARLHYIWYNPVKHGYVDDPKNWKFGSYYCRFKENEDEIDEIIDQYPCDQVKVYDDF